jgi:pyoverdine/dityrosine biosynthesis protein Dit1
MGIEDAEVWDYSTAIRDIIKAKELRHITALRIVDLLSHSATENLTREEYLIHAGCYRRELVAKFSPGEFDPRQAIKKDADICLTYRGYIKFLTKDLKYSRVAEETQRQENPKKRYKEAIENIALSMITRGKVSPVNISNQDQS